MREIWSLLVVLAILMSSCAPSAPTAEQGKSLLDRTDTIKSAFMSIESPNPDSVRTNIYSSLNAFEAEITDEHWSDPKHVQFSGSLTIRVPSEKFLTLVESIKNQYKDTSLSLRARERIPSTTEVDSGAADRAYSEIHIALNRPIGIAESFSIGLESAEGALKLSIQSLVPVFVFLTPYALVIFGVFLGTRWVIRRTRGSGK